MGHIVSALGVASDSEKIEVVQQLAPPSNIKVLQAFLGTTGYYLHYIEQYAPIDKPLYLLTNNNACWEWSKAAHKSLKELKELKGHQTAAPILGYPDPAKTYILDTDVRAFGIIAVLSQEEDGWERVASYHSKYMSATERDYCVTRKEWLAIVRAEKHFRPYLYGRFF